MKECQDEIINSLLKANFDYIKDESLDIDFAACSAIPISANHNNTFFDWEGTEKSFPATAKQQETEVEGNSHTADLLLKCKKCGEEFQNESALTDHKKARKNCAKKACPICGKKLSINSMWLHRKIHDDNKKFSCDICGQTFVQRINLVHHLKNHTGELPFQCPQCQKSFPEKSHLKRHQRYHVDVKIYKCEKCGKMYKTERCLKVHSLVHLDKRPFVCTECGKSFLSSSKLKQHSNIHTGARPYKCRYCSRDFTNFPNWLKHTRRRHKVDHKTGQLLETVPNYGAKQKAATQKTPRVVKDKKKNELPATCDKATTTFRDVCSLSIGNAEEIIEQALEMALEMEEDGLIPELRSPLISQNNALLLDSDIWETPRFNEKNIIDYLSPQPTTTTTISSTTMNSSCSRTNTTTLPSVDTIFKACMQQHLTHSSHNSIIP